MDQNTYDKGREVRAAVLGEGYVNAAIHSFAVQMNLISPLWFAKLGKHIGDGLHARHAAAIGNLIWATLRGLVVAQLVVTEPVDTRRERRVLVDMITAYVENARA